MTKLNVDDIILNYDPAAPQQQAAQIYAKHGGLTTAASVIASWAVVHSYN